MLRDLGAEDVCISALATLCTATYPGLMHLVCTPDQVACYSHLRTEHASRLCKAMLIWTDGQPVKLGWVTNDDISTILSSQNGGLNYISRLQSHAQ